MLIHTTAMFSHSGTVGHAGECGSQHRGTSWDHITLWKQPALANCSDLTLSPGSAHLLRPWDRDLTWTSQVLCGPHGYRVELASVMWTHQRGMEGVPPAWHWPVPGAPSAAGCPQSWLARGAQSTLTAQAIPSRSRTWHSGRCHLHPGVDGTSWWGLTHLSRVDPFPQSTEVLKLNWLLGARLGEHNRTTTSPLTDCALMPDAPGCGTGRGRVPGLSSTKIPRGLSSCQGGF